MVTLAPRRVPLIPHLVDATGMFRVYAKQLHPRFELYVSPVNLDPDEPELPISAPAGHSREISCATSRYYTQGIAEDTGVSSACRNFPRKPAVI